MISLQQLSRSVPRMLLRSLPVTARSAMVTPLVARIPRPTVSSLTSKILSQQKYATFSTGTILNEPAGESDAELLAKLEEEYRHETELEAEELDGSVENIKLLQESGIWEVKDTPGEQEVILSRKFGNEKIRLTFTVADLQNLGENAEFDDALADEMDYDNPGHAANTAAPGPSGAVVHTEDNAAPADREFDDEMDEPSFPARVTVTIEKPGSGALLIQTVVQEGVFEVEEVSFFSKPELANVQSADKDWDRQSLYAGPPFENLDEDLQTYFERYLEERGINTELANVIPDYIQVKEQKEYVRWLESVKNFVAA